MLPRFSHTDMDVEQDAQRSASKSSSCSTDSPGLASRRPPSERNCSHGFKPPCSLQALRAVQFGEIPVEGAERQMTGFAGNFQNEAIGEAQ